MHLIQRLTCAALFLFLLPLPGLATTFDLGGQVIDLGTQPVSFPDVMFSETIKRDRILQNALTKAGWQVRQHAYFKGNDMLPHLGGDQLEAAMFGDMPTINAVAQHDLLIVGLMKHTFSSVVTNRYMPMTELKGKRVGNGTGSTAHYTLLEGLASAGLSEQDVQLVDMNVNDMPTALQNGKIDAFSAWEPAPTIALAQNPAHFVAYRGVNNAYLVLSRKLAERHPEVARQFIAAFARALYWMKKSPDNLKQAATWALKAGEAFSGKPPNLTVEQAMAITAKEAVNVPGAPALPKGEATPNGRMAGQLAFLKQLTKVPQATPWSKVANSFAPQWLEEILRQPGRYRVFAYDYAP